MHKLIQLREAGAGFDEIAAILAPDVVFKSPVFSRNVEGREQVAKSMLAAASARNGRYVSEMSDGNRTLLVWSGTVDGKPLDSFEMLLHDDAGLIVERTVAMRPFSSVVHFRNAMYRAMKDTLGPSYFKLADDLVIEGA